jgi:hypothetical protein
MNKNKDTGSGFISFKNKKLIGRDQLSEEL